VVEDTRFLYRVFRPWRHLEERPPETLHIETTNVCNANCIFCAYQYQDRFREGKGVMSDKIFSRGLREYFEMGGRSVNFVPLVGDSLVDPKIIQRVRQAKDFGFYVEMFTNGILFNRMDLKTFLETGVNCVTLSTGPFDRENYELLYRTSPGKYEDLL